MNRLASAIKLKQLEKEKNHEINVCVIEKGSEIGAHTLSGNVFEPSGIEALYPDWKNMENVILLYLLLYSYCFHFIFII